MDKRWRNMGILFVIVILIVAGYFIYSNKGGPVVLPFQKVSLEAGYSEIVSAFESNDVNLTNVQALNIVNLSNANKVVWVEDKASLLRVKTQLVNFSTGIASRAESKEVSDELKAAADLYVAAIDFGIKNEVYLNDLAKGANKDFSCSDLTFIRGLPAKAEDMYSDLEKLSNKNDDFILTYDLYSMPLLIDLDTEKEFVDFSKVMVQQIEAYCAGGGSA